MIPRTTILHAGLAVFIIFLTAVQASGQYFDIGQDPCSLKWRQIKTEHFRFIYPAAYERQARHLAAFSDSVYRYGSFSLKSKPRRVPVILHTLSVISNATAPWAPRRIEILTCPPQDIYAESWLYQVLIHEFRHTVQVEKMYQGFSRGLYYILGEQVAAGLTGLFVPFWFTEGDATATETAISHSGRGRVPSFEMELRTQLLTDGRYGYNKAVFGSYRDHVPDNYILGYHLVSMGRAEYGTVLWDHAMNTVGRKPFLITPFTYGIRSVTGISRIRLYRHLADTLAKAWHLQQQKETYTAYTTISRTDTKFYTSYRHPQFIGDSTYISLKTSIDDIGRLVKVDKYGRETIVHTPGLYFGEAISYAQGLAAWSERLNDPRWSQRSYAVIKVFDSNTGKVKQLTRKSRLFAPSLSHDATQIVSVEAGTADVYALVILDVSTGKEIKRIAMSGGLFLMTPSWSPDDKNIVAVVMDDRGKSLVLVDPVTGSIRHLTPFSFTEIATPVMYENYVFYTGAYSCISNIYAVDTATLLIYRVTSSVFGAFDPAISADGKEILYADYSGKGYKLVKAGIEKSQWVPLEEIADNRFPLDVIISQQELGVPPVDTTKSQTFTSMRYRKWKNLINPHSWAPLAIDAQNQTFMPGVSVLSQNALSTSFLSLGYAFDLNEQVGRYYMDYSYRGFYPVIDVTFNIGQRAGEQVDEHDRIERFTWHENNLSLKATVLQDYNRNAWFMGWQPTVGSELIHIHHDDLTPDDFIEGNIQAMEYRLVAYNQIKTGYRDIYPRWAQAVDINYRHTPFTGNSLGDIWSAESYLYFPGILPHQGIKLYAGYQSKHPKNYSFSDLITYPRGYSELYFDEAASFSVNYKFPLLYPDLSLSSLLYLMRVKVNLFYDYAIGTNDQGESVNTSAGIELTGDMHILRFLSPLDLGVRTTYLPNNNTFGLEFLFSINFTTWYKDRSDNEPLSPEIVQVKKY
ncbi:MAG: hypothetical protein NT175_11400 [Bacteroidetes bacterium]|nr:hypothetical protein [Bacteroidota bacterium]